MAGQTTAELQRGQSVGARTPAIQSLYFWRKDNPQEQGDGEFGYRKLALRKGRRSAHVVNRIHVDARPQDRKKGAWELTKKVLMEAQFAMRMIMLVLAYLQIRHHVGF
jgi:hypothetical protein